MQLYRAQYIYPVSSPPITNGIIAIEDERIAAVGPAAEITQRYPGAQVKDLGQVMLMPQAINVHTHLELTTLAEIGKQQISDLSFCKWVPELLKIWRATPADIQIEGARAGCRMLLESATAAVGDISNTHASLEPLLESGLHGIIYHEVLSPNPADAAQLLQKAKQQIRHWRSEYGEQRIRFGVTLHTLFTVSPEIFRAFLPWVIEERIPLCIHAAESPAELEYLLFGTGDIATSLFPPAVPILQWIPTPRLSSIRYLDKLNVLKVQPLLVHGVQVDRDDLRLLAQHKVPMAHCPRSNLLLNCGRMPIELYQEASVPLALGTDSLASSPSLSVWEEAASAVKVHAAAGVQLDPHDVLRLCTLDGARALGFAHLLGSLEPGKLAKLAMGKPEKVGKEEIDLVPTVDEMLQLLWDGEVTVSL